MTTVPPTPTTTLRTAELKAMLDDPATALIDVRTPEAYNGWRFHGEPRGGHIRGARCLPAAWVDLFDWGEVVRGKGIEPSQRVVLYGRTDDDHDRVAARFRREGYARVEVYDRFADEWCAAPDLPLDRMPRYRQLVSAPWLATLLRTGSAPELDNDHVVLLHAHYRNPAAYHDGHIPGAVAVDTNQLESPDTWNRRSPEELADVLAGLGITHDTTVILYGRFASPDNADPYPGSAAGQLGAMRCAAILLYAGVEDVRLLNGGLMAWLNAGYELSTDPTPPTPVASFGGTIPARPEYMIDTPEAHEYLRDPNSNLISVRSWPEYTGELSGYNYIEKRGRIPGSVFGNCGSDAYHMENFRNPDHTTREYHELVREWAASGITPMTRNAFYCGTGWRAAEAFINAWLLGWPRIAVYDGGWFEWSADDRNPVATGIPETVTNQG